MWEGWKTNTDTVDNKGRELMVQTDVAGSLISVLLVATLARIEPGNAWKVEIVAFAPSAGDSTLYERAFPDFAQAEETAWAKAQEEVRKRRRPGAISSIDGEAVPPPSEQKRKRGDR
jgi:hypothetical protein